jgi:hypothetical protein
MGDDADITVSVLTIKGIKNNHWIRAIELNRGIEPPNLS